MKYTVCVFICLLISVISYSQHSYSSSDSLSKSVKATSLEALHKNLTKGLKNDEEKVRAFYVWIADNIKYDVAEWSRPSGEISKQSAENVFKNRKGVCHGYSSLFKSLCDLSGIKCFLVNGYAKPNGFFSGAGHAWNVVSINGKWQPVDVTWGAGYVTERKVFVKEFDDKYFLASPDEFLATHYPFDPAWQLVANPVKVKDYKSTGWVYRPEKAAPVYNFNDTIQQWLLIDSSMQNLESAARMIRMNPDDVQAKDELARAQMEFAYRQSMKGRDILSSINEYKNSSGGRKPMSNEELQSQLDLAYVHFSTADSVLKKANPSNQSDRTYIAQTRSILKQNLSMIESERQRRH